MEDFHGKKTIEIKTPAELRVMTQKELTEYLAQFKVLEDSVVAEKARRKAVKARKAEVKAQYASLINREFTYHVSTSRLQALVEGAIKSGKQVDAEMYEEFVKKATEADFKPREEAYPCPHCGKFLLRPAYYDEGYPNEKATIYCDSSDCDFEIRVDNRSCYSDKASWWGLEDWLVKHGYMTGADKI